MIITCGVVVPHPPALSGHLAAQKPAA